MSNRDYNSEEWIREKYRNQNLGPTEISKLSDFDISPATISHRVSDFNIEKRHRDPEWLYDKYVDEGLSSVDISDICGVCPQTVLNNLEKHDIERVSIEDRWDEYDPPLLNVTGDDHPNSDRTGPDHHFWGVTGEDHPSYTGGQNWRDGSRWRRLRDEYVDLYPSCYICGSSEDIHVHHITPVSKGGRKYDPEFLESLCQKCHFEHHSMTYNVDPDWNEDVEWVKNQKYT